MSSTDESEQCNPDTASQDWGDTEGGRAIARRNYGAGVEAPAPQARGDSPRVPPGPRQQTSQPGRRGPGGNTESAAGGGGGACLLLKSGVRAGGWSLGGDRKAARGGKRTADAGAWAGAGWVAARPAAEACTRLGAEPALAAATAKGPRLRASRGGCWARAGCRSAGARPGARRRAAATSAARAAGSARVYMRLPPHRGPHPQRRGVCSADPRCLCSYAVRARPRPPGRGSRRVNPPAAGHTVAAAAGSEIRLPAWSETWCPTGLACMT